MLMQLVAHNNLIGYLAAGLVLMAFCMKDMISLRAIALASNIAFLIYGLTLGLAPVWLLHAILLPVNFCRLCQALSESQSWSNAVIRSTKRLHKKRALGKLTIPGFIMLTALLLQPVRADGSSGFSAIAFRGECSHLAQTHVAFPWVFAP